MQGQQGQRPHNNEEADVASQPRDAVRRPSGLEKGLRERTTNSSSGDVLRERRVPGLAGSGATNSLANTAIARARKGKEEAPK